VSGIGATPPPLPPEVLQEERDRIRQQLELERGKSRILYEKAYQDYLVGQTGAHGKTKSAATVSHPDFMDVIKKAYTDAIALRAFRDVMDDTMGRGETPAAESIPSSDNLMTTLMKSGVPPQIVNQWLKNLDPEALGALIAFSSQGQNPGLSQLAFAVSQRGGQKDSLTIKDVIELNQALSKTQGAPNINLDIPKLIEAVRAAPAAASPSEIMETTLKAIQTGMQLVTPGKSEEPKAKGLLEELLRTPEGIKTAKEIGLIGSDASMMTIIAEMRKNDQAFEERRIESDKKWQLRLEQLHAETSIKKHQIVESRRRTNMIGSALQRIGTAVAKGMTEGGEEEAEGKAATGGRIPDNSGIKQYKCEGCGSLITVPPDAQIGANVTCAKCGAVYEVMPETAASK
jgi:DNA-directed RNA polymerase subunit RPC12/RpoP